MIKIIILYIFRSLGIFKVAKYLIRKKLLILAYHGLEINDESLFRPGLFIKKETFERRMKYIKNNKFKVITLNDAVQSLDRSQYVDNSIVITFDDGWYSTLYCADEILSKYSYPYTVYITTYYAKYSDIPVLNVLLSYIIWYFKEKNYNTITFNLIINKFNLDPVCIDKLDTILQDYLRGLDGISEKVKFVKDISNLCNFNYDKALHLRCFNILSFSEIQLLYDKGCDIQLHTHRHRMPLGNCEEIKKELTDNRCCLFPLVAKDTCHFCYPSGIYDENCERILVNMDIRSAVTCEPGFVTKKNNRFYLPRFLDGEDVHQICFEAELCGVLYYMRKFRFYTGWHG